MESFKTFLANANLLDTAYAWAINIVLALVIYVIGKWISERIGKLCRKLLGRAKMDPTLVNFLSNIVFAVLMVAVVLAALDTLGIPVTSLLAIVGAAGLAVGLALKDSLGNFAAGVMLVMFRPFVRGDLVEVAGVTGIVQEVHIFNTVLNSLDNKVVIIPNGQISSATITNYSTNATRRVDLVFSVSYDDDLKVGDRRRFRGASLGEQRGLLDGVRRPARAGQARTPGRRLPYPASAEIRAPAAES